MFGGVEPLRADRDAGAAVPARALEAMPVREITVFKDGHAFVLHEGTMPTNEAGDVVMDTLPAPVLGTFWPFSSRPDVELTAVVAGRRSVTVERTALSLRELLEANPQLLHESTKAGYTPLESAVAGRQVDVVAYLLEAGADPRGPDRTTPLHLVAKSFLFIIRARLSQGEERAEYVDKLAEAGAEAGAGVPASIELWRQMWQKQLAYQARVVQCGPLKACVAQAAKQRTLSDREIDERVGAQSGLIMRSGILSAGTVQATFNFSGESGLEPVVSVEPRLLAVEFPPR